MSRIADLRVIGERFSTSVVDGQPLPDGRKGRLVIVAHVIACERMALDAAAAEELRVRSSMLEDEDEALVTALEAAPRQGEAT